MDLTNTTDGITDLPTSRDNWKISAAERRPKGPLDSKVTLKNKSLNRNNCGNNREDRDTIDTSRSSSRSQISTIWMNFSLHIYYAALFLRRGRIMRCTLSICLSVCPSIPLSLRLQACAHMPWQAARRHAQRAAYCDGRVGRTDTC